ncbi:MAG: hypothetical protein M3220_01250 [Chloroflexota bacterium]|nr:hypothetical protein [Chloroflexota bacterium]
MSLVLEVDEQGELHVPAELLGNAMPHTRYVVETAGDIVILHPERSRSIRETATPEERAEGIRQWAYYPRPAAPILSLEAISRENIYD